MPAPSQMQLPLGLSILCVLLACLPLLRTRRDLLLVDPALYVLAIVMWSPLLKVVSLALADQPATDDRVTPGLLLVLVGTAGYTTASLATGRSGGRWLGDLAERLTSKFSHRSISLPRPLLWLAGLLLLSFLVYLELSDIRFFAMPFSEKRFNPTDIGVGSRFDYLPYYFFKVSLLSSPVAFAATLLFASSRGVADARRLGFWSTLFFLFTLTIAYFASLRLFVLITLLQIVLLALFHRQRRLIKLALAFTALTVLSFAAITLVHRPFQVPRAAEGEARTYSAAVGGRYFMDVEKLSRLVEHFPTEHPHLRGRGLLGGLPLMQETAEPAVHTDRYLARHLFGEPTNSIPPGFTGEMYVNFGWLGVLLGFAGLGTFHRLLFEQLADRRSGSLLTGCLLALIPTTTLILLNSGVVPTIVRGASDIVFVLAVWLPYRSLASGFREPASSAPRAVPVPVVGSERSLEGAAGVEWPARWSRWAALGVMLSPLFLTLPGLELLLARLASPGIPPNTYENAVSLLSLFIAALGVPLLPAFLRGIRNRSPLLISALGLAGYFLALGVVGALRARDVFPILAAVQYVFPIAAFAIGYLARYRYTIDWVRVSVLFVAVNLALPLAVFLHFYFGDGGYSAIGALRVTNRYFYGLFSHLPMMMLLASIFLIGVVRRRAGAVLSFASAAVLGVVFASWSRAAVLGATVALAALVALLGWFAVSRRAGDLRPKLLVSLALVVACVVVPRFGMVGHRADLVASVAKAPAEPTSPAPPPRSGTPERPVPEAATVRAESSSPPRPSRPATSDARPARPSQPPASPPSRGAEVEDPPSLESPPVETPAHGPAEPAPVVATPPGPPDASAGAGGAPSESTTPRRSRNTLEASTSSRVRYMREGLARWLEAPMFGILFVPDQEAIIHGKLVSRKQIFQSHNQYIDILLKAGLLGLVLWTAFYGWFVARPLAAATFGRTTGWTYRLTAGVMLAILAGVAVAANFQLYFTVWTTGVPLGFLLGYVTGGRARVGTGEESIGRDERPPSGPGERQKRDDLGA